MLLCMVPRPNPEVFGFTSQLSLGGGYIAFKLGLCHIKVFFLQKYHYFS